MSWPALFDAAGRVLVARRRGGTHLARLPVFAIGGPGDSDIATAAIRGARGVAAMRGFRGTD